MDLRKEKIANSLLPAYIHEIFIVDCQWVTLKNEEKGGLDDALFYIVLKRGQKVRRRKKT